MSTFSRMMLAALVTVLFLCPIAQAEDAPDELVLKVRNAMLTMQRYSWEQGVAGQALWEWGDKELAVQLAYSCLIYTKGDGRLAAQDGGGGATDPGMAGEVIWQAAKQTGDAKLQKAADNLRDYFLKRCPRAKDGTVFHVFGPEIWVDSFNCVPPFLAVCGQTDESLKQIEGFHSRLWSAKDKLYSHMYNEDRKALVWADYWGVGNGWAAVGLTRVVGALPPERAEDKARVAGYVRELLDGALACQRPDGLFPNMLNKPDSFVETNAAQMFAYAIYRGVAGGWLPDTYIPAADRMRQAARAKVDDHGFVQGVCGAPDFNHPGIAAEGQAAFILMEAAARDYRAKAK